MAKRIIRVTRTEAVCAICELINGEIDLTDRVYTAINKALTGLSENALEEQLSKLENRLDALDYYESGEYTYEIEKAPPKKKK